MVRGVITLSVQIGIDVVSDILILFIPVYLIWRIQVQRAQKIALTFTLCLTIILIAITLVRASGLRSQGSLDITWEAYWQFLSTEVGLIIASAAAFRTLFVAQAAKQHPSGNRGQWYSYSKKLFQQSLRPWTWRVTKSTGHSSKDSNRHGSDRDDEFKNLPDIPHGTMTGIRTFINGRGRTSTMSILKIMKSRVVEEDEERLPPRADHNPREITVQHDICAHYEEDMSKSQSPGNNRFTQSTKGFEFRHDLVESCTV